MGVNSPCFNCKPPKRHVGCHIDCPEDKIYRAEQEKIKEAIKRAKLPDKERSSLMQDDYYKYMMIKKRVRSMKHKK